MSRLFVPLETLERIAAEYDKPLCAECKARYDPAASVSLEEENGVLHIWCTASRRSPTGWVLLDKEVGRLCGTKGTRAGVRCLILPNETLVNYLPELARRYPKIVGRPLTAGLLRSLGCDIEAELAMWVLGR
jgi:hypothetical protein